MISLSSQKRPILTVAGIAILMLAIFSILLTGTSHFDRSVAEQKLHEFSEFIAQEAAAGGKEGKFTFGSIEMEGWGYDKQGIVKNVSLEVSEEALLDTNKLSVSTGTLIIRPNRMVADSWLFVFPEPFNVIQNSQLTGTVIASGPITYGIQNLKINGDPGHVHRLQLPNQISLLPATVAGETNEVQGRIDITYAENPTLTVRYVPQNQSYSISYLFNNLRVVRDGASLIAVGLLSSQHDEAMAQDGKVSGKYALAMENIVTGQDTMDVKPYNVSADFSYHGDQPSMDMRGLAPDFSNMEIEFGNLSISGEGYKVRATGMLTTASDDPLPFGALDVDINDINKLMDSGLVPEQVKGAVTHALQKITGGTAESHVVFALKREKNGVFYVGNITFEHLAATVITHMLKPTVAPLPPSPAVETVEPLPAPIESAPSAGEPVEQARH